MLDIRGFTYGLALGAGSMFFLDPVRGDARRARARHSSRRLVHDVENAAQKGGRQISDRLRSIGERARSLEANAGNAVTGTVLTARVRSRLSRVTSHAHAIQIKLKEGNRLELKGPVLTEEHDRIVQEASRVPGVESIDDDLALYSEADGIPGLQDVESGGEELAPGERSLAQVIAAVPVVLLLASRLAPMLFATVLGATVRNLLQGAAPQVMKRIGERIGEEGSAGGRRRRGELRGGQEEEAERAQSDESRAHPT